MGLARGNGALKAMRDAAPKKSNGGGMTYRPKDGDSDVCRFFGDFEGAEAPNPVYAKKHNHRHGGTTDYDWCGDNAEQHAGCVYCYVGNSQSQATRKGEGGVSTSVIALFFIKVYTKQHRFEQEVRAPDGTMSKYVPCNAPKPCSYCRLNNESRPRGYMPFEINEWFIDDLKNYINTIRDYCFCNGRDEKGNGPIYVTKWGCPTCGEDVVPNEQGLARCEACRKTEVPQELEFTCLCCDDARRASMQDALFRISCTGKGLEKGYSFDLIRIEAPTPDEIAEAEKYQPNWEAHAAPISAEEQAQKLGLPESPYHTEGHGAKPFGRREDGFLGTSQLPPKDVQAVTLAAKQPPKVGMKLAGVQTVKTQTAKPNMSNTPKVALAPRKLTLGFKKAPTPPPEETDGDEIPF